MKTLISTVSLACVLVLSSNAGAQTPPPQSNPMSTWLRGSYTTNRNYLARTAEKMPDDLYSMRPGAQMEVRTFGQILGHLANLNFMWCSQAKGEKNPNQGHDFEKAATKAELVKGLNDALTYCDTAYSALTDASGMETIPITQENGRQTQSLRMSLLVLNYGHNNEHYGNLVTYMRIKSIVPPSSEPRP
jgi:uncharacterized damage-inducible protein DinB